MFYSQKEVWKHLVEGGTVVSGSYLYKFAETGAVVKSSCTSRAKSWMETTETFKKFNDFKSSEYTEVVVKGIAMPSLSSEKTISINPRKINEAYEKHLQEEIIKEIEAARHTRPSMFDEEDLDDDY